MATEYRMTCFSNIEQALKREGLTFTETTESWSEHAGTLRVAGREVEGPLVGWEKINTPHVYQLVDYMTGRIYHLLGDVTDAEALAFQVACSYTNGGNK